MRFRVFGPLEMWDDGTPIQIGPPRQCAVLAALLVDCGRPVTVDALVQRAWGADPPDRAARTLHTYISRLRHLVGAEYLVRRPGGYLMDVDPEQVDLHRFRRLVGGARDGPERLARLREAVALCRGELLAGIGGDWAERTRRSWQQERIDALVAWARAELDTGDPAAVCTTLRALVEEQPLVEPAVEVLIRALAATGRTAQALQHYAALREQLAKELGADPAPQLQATYLALLRSSPTTTPTETGDRGSAPPRDAPDASDARVTPGAVPSTIRPPAPPAGQPRWRRIERLLAGSWSRRTVTAALILAVTAVAVGVWRVAPPRGDSGSAGGLSARTTLNAPIFHSERLIRTLPAGQAISVFCWYRGNPPHAWTGDGLEYYVGYRASDGANMIGHIPDPYVDFGPGINRRPPGSLRGCGPGAPASPR